VRLKSPWGTNKVDILLFKVHRCDAIRMNCHLRRDVIIETAVLVEVMKNTESFQKELCRERVDERGHELRAGLNVIAAVNVTDERSAGMLVETCLLFDVCDLWQSAVLQSSKYCEENDLIRVIGAEGLKAVHARVGHAS